VACAPRSASVLVTRAPRLGEAKKTLNGAGVLRLRAARCGRLPRESASESIQDQPDSGAKGSPFRSVSCASPASNIGVGWGRKWAR